MKRFRGSGVEDGHKGRRKRVHQDEEGRKKKRADGNRSFKGDERTVDSDPILDGQMQKWKAAALDQKRKKEQSQRMVCDVLTGKKWSLDNDADCVDDDAPPEGDPEQSQLQDMDPLDAFMSGLVLPGLDEKKDHLQSHQEEGDSGGEESDGDEEGNPPVPMLKLNKSKNLQPVTHYPPFKKNFYREAKDLSMMTAEQVATWRKKLELTAHGKNICKPIKSWEQAGLTYKVMEVIKQAGYDKPMAVQAQAIPVIMSGRDCIGVARTGSGKTLAYVLPMLRHVMNQANLQPGDGPIALVMAPTRELVTQIHGVVKKFAKAFGGQTALAVYGGSQVQNQINSLKKGAEVVVCTPGRIIDMLCSRITNLRRLTFLVMDEADRMFDLGFEPQIKLIVENARVDRQTVLFSATFPVQVEALARKVLRNPVDIHVGGRNVVNEDITQLVELRHEEDDRYKRLLELLGEWRDKGKILVFVNSQEKCDSLFQKLFFTASHPCLSLHGSKDQNDRESTIADFKSNACSVLIATSVAARGLDIEDLVLVVNYDVPNHYEEYVHRVGRTGRAGRKGTAVTFISRGEERYAADLIKALQGSGQAVPEDLKSMVDMVDQQELKHGSGYGGRGHKFNAEEEEARKAARRAQAKSYGFVDDDDDEADEAAATATTTPPATATTTPPAAATAKDVSAGALAAAVAKAKAVAASLTKSQADDRHTAEVEINELPQRSRQRLTRKDMLERIREETGASVSIKGRYIPPGSKDTHGERKLYLLIQGESEVEVRRAHASILEELKACDVPTVAPLASITCYRRSTLGTWEYPALVSASKSRTSRLC